MEKLRSRGITRGVDELGRVVLPLEYRKVLDIEPKDRVKITLKDNGFFIAKTQSQCCFCHEAKELIELNDKKVCKNCLKLLNEAAQ